ncbi:HAD family hydrolase [Mycobacterium saskatchewanense]|nr:HAD family hydrolase [Mycobacterium saskatchewanense]
MTDGDLAIAEESALECLCGEGLRLPGFLGITDTPRPDARELLLGLAKRDIGVRVITGDRPATARAIARQIGLDVADESVITGARWERLSVAERAEVVSDTVIYAHDTRAEGADRAADQPIRADLRDGGRRGERRRGDPCRGRGVGVSSHGSGPARGAADVGQTLLESRAPLVLGTVAATFVTLPPRPNRTRTARARPNLNRQRRAGGPRTPRRIQTPSAPRRCAHCGSRSAARSTSRSSGSSTGPTNTTLSMSRDWRRC